MSCYIFKYILHAINGFTCWWVNGIANIIVIKQSKRMSDLFVTLLTEITFNMVTATATVTLLIPILAAAMNASSRFIYLRHQHRKF